MVRTNDSLFRFRVNCPVFVRWPNAISRPAHTYTEPAHSGCMFNNHAVSMPIAYIHGVLLVCAIVGKICCPWCFITGGGVVCTIKTQEWWKEWYCCCILYVCLASAAEKLEMYNNYSDVYWYIEILRCITIWYNYAGVLIFLCSLYKLTMKAVFHHFLEKFLACFQVMHCTKCWCSNM